MNRDKCECGGAIGGQEYMRGNKYRYDGVSEEVCLLCGERVGRWCGQVLDTGMVEPPFCNGGGHPRVMNLEDEKEE